QPAAESGDHRTDSAAEDSKCRAEPTALRWDDSVPHGIAEAPLGSAPRRRIRPAAAREEVRRGHPRHPESGNAQPWARNPRATRARHKLGPMMIRKAVIPAAGIGSRLLPLTKAIPKEMLPVGDKPVIEHTVRELVASGITDITIVVSGGKSLIQDHFRPNPALVAQLRADGKTAYADAVEEVGELSRLGHITYLDQHGPYGNGTPVLNAARAAGDEPMLVLWPDDVFVAEVPRAQQLIRAYEATGCPVLALMPMNPNESQRYGVPVVREDLDDGLLRISGLVEKPKPADAPSAYA